MRGAMARNDGGNAPVVAGLAPAGATALMLDADRLPVELA